MLDATRFPLFVDNTLWTRFYREYSLLRRANADEKMRVRDDLQTKHWSVLIDLSGRGIDSLQGEMSTWSGSSSPKESRNLVLLPKMAAFANPSIFIAMDSYAQKGLRKKLGDKKYASGYAGYLSAVRDLMETSLKTEIDCAIDASGVDTGKATRDAFRLRVLDHYLMMMGGRRHTEHGYV